MKKSRGYSTTMNYLSGSGGGNDGGNCVNEPTAEELQDYHNYPTATRDYSMRGANSTYQDRDRNYRPASYHESQDYTSYPKDYNYHNSKDYQNYHNSTKDYQPQNYHNYNDSTKDYQSQNYHNYNSKDYQPPREYGSLGRAYRHDPPAYNHSADDYHTSDHHDRGSGSAYSTGPRTGGYRKEDYQDRPNAGYSTGPRTSTSSTGNYPNYHDRPKTTIATTNYQDYHDHPKSTSSTANYQRDYHPQDYHDRPKTHSTNYPPEYHSRSKSDLTNYPASHHDRSKSDVTNYQSNYHDQAKTDSPNYHDRPKNDSPKYQPNYHDHGKTDSPNYPPNYHDRGKTDSPNYPERTKSNSSSNYQDYRQSPRHRYRNADDYHYDYRGGYRPGIDPEGYTTDGSGSGYRSGSGGAGKGYENYRYPESEELLPRHRSNHSSNHSGDYYTKGEGGGEKTPFLDGRTSTGSQHGGEPVRLTPSWENTNLPKEELNFKNLSAFETFEVGAEPPRDRYRLVFLTLVLHGVGTLMPWNMFITAKNYFVDYKLREEDGELSAYSTNFLPYIGYASQVPNVLFNWLNIFIQMGGNLTTRIVWSIIVEVVVFVFTVILAMIDSSDWTGVFFWITIVSVIILNIANGIYQNTVYGMAARLPFSYTGAVVLGSNISGTFTAVINIIAIAMAPSIRTSAIYYFITALFILLACFDTYFALPLNRFYRYHEGLHERAQRASKRQTGRPRVPYWRIFKSAFPQLFNVFMVFFVTLAVFPAVLADTCRTEENFPVSPKYFQAVTCFLTFNLFAMFGNMLPGLFTWPSPRYLCIPVLLRIFLIPAFVLCHYYPINVDRVMPVLIDSDWAYWALTVVLGITSGYFSSLAMMYCPRTVEAEFAPVAGMMGAASLITGIFGGIVFQVMCTWSVTNIAFEIPGHDFPMRNCTNRLS